MSLHSRKILECDKCGEAVTFAYDGPNADIFFTPFASSGKPWENWLELDGGQRHLCPKCAEAYEQRRRQMQRELDELAGIRHIDISI